MIRLLHLEYFGDPHESSEQPAAGVPNAQSVIDRKYPDTLSSDSPEAIRAYARFLGQLPRPDAIRLHEGF